MQISEPYPVDYVGYPLSHKVSCSNRAFVLNRSWSNLIQNQCRKRPNKVFQNGRVWIGDPWFLCDLVCTTHKEQSAENKHLLKSTFLWWQHFSFLEQLLHEWFSLLNTRRLFNITRGGISTASRIINTSGAVWQLGPCFGRARSQRVGLAYASPALLHLSPPGWPRRLRACGLASVSVRGGILLLYWLVVYPVLMVVPVHGLARGAMAWVLYQLGSSGVPAGKAVQASVRWVEGCVTLGEGCTPHFYPVERGSIGASGPCVVWSHLSVKWVRAPGFSWKLQRLCGWGLSGMLSATFGEPAAVGGCVAPRLSLACLHLVFFAHSLHCSHLVSHLLVHLWAACSGR